MRVVYAECMIVSYGRTQYFLVSEQWHHHTNKGLEQWHHHKQRFQMGMVWLYCTHNIHTTLYGSAAGCRSIQKTCAFWKHGLTFENTQSQLTYFCKSNINQTFTNGSGMIWGVIIAIFIEIRHVVEELITFLCFLNLRNWAFWQLE